MRFKTGLGGGINCILVRTQKYSIVSKQNTALCFSLWDYLVKHRIVGNSRFYNVLKKVSWGCFLAETPEIQLR